MGTTRENDGGEPVKIGVVQLLASTKAAIQILAQHADKAHWVPKAVIHENSEIYGTDVLGKEQKVGERGVLIVKKWWWRKNGGKK